MYQPQPGPYVQPPQKPRRANLWRFAGIVLGGFVLLCAAALIFGPSQEELAARKAATAEAGTAVALANPSATPAPSATAGPTDTPPPPTGTPTNEQRLTALLIDAFGPSTRDVDRLVDVMVPLPGATGAVLVVEWNINELLSDESTTAGAKRDALLILQTVRESGVPYGEGIRVMGRYPLVDQFGTVTDERVINLLFRAPTVDRFTFENVNPADMYELADEATIKPAFRE